LFLLPAVFLDYACAQPAGSLRGSLQMQKIMSLFCLRPACPLKFRVEQKAALLYFLRFLKSFPLRSDAAACLS
jgi:hypothetical protein